MSFQPRKWHGFVLLLAFVVTTLGSVPGFAWCIGEDGHFEIEYIAAEGCGGETVASDIIAGSPSVHIDEDHCGPCRDFYLPSPEAMSANRFHPKTLPSPDFIASNRIPSITFQAASLIVANLVPQPPPRISQAVLEHRTTVLLI